MKTNKSPYSTALLIKGTTLLSTLLAPLASFAEAPKALIVPMEMSISSYLVIGFLLILAVVMFLLFKRRYNITVKELEDVIAELSITRNRLTDTHHKLEAEKVEHKETTARYSNILFDAQVGMFQLDLSNKCTYINTALQQMSGLYPKKAMKEGIQSAIHPDDKPAFVKAYDAFTHSKDSTFEHAFRFTLAKEGEIHVICKINKAYNARKEVESYIGWISNITEFHNGILEQKAETARFENFVSQAVEGFYKLTPSSPILLDDKPSTISSSILNTMTIGDCNNSFAALYGVEANELVGKRIGDLKDGCGPFESTESVQDFIKAGYQAIDLESTRRDPDGNQLDMLNNIVAVVEDDHLVGIWGTQSNITRQKREKTELTGKLNFMHRILNSLPADVHVKDTRCRYLYASKKVADRTGIPQKEWLGKTIFDVIPGTPREHDQLAIESMKTGKLQRCERPYEAKGKKGWMENLQIPLVNNEGLLEGVVSLSLEITERKLVEKEALRKHMELETKLVNTQNTLADTKKEQGQTSVALSDAMQKLKVAEGLELSRKHEFQKQLAEQKRAEETLRRNEQGLLARQQQLEEQLAKRLEELDAETDKRTKWEELLSIKEDELRKLEENVAELSEHYSQETSHRKHAENNLKEVQAALTEARAEAADLSENREREIEELTVGHTAALEAEQLKRNQAEKHLTRAKEFLDSTQEQIKRMTDQHETELEKEVAERKATAEKLVKSMKDLDELRSNFSQRIEEETKAVKNELAQKQIREKALRQHEQDLEKRIKELENTLQKKSQEQAEQIQAREGVEDEKNQIEQQMEQLTREQQKILAHEKQKLNLSIAEIRLSEVKLRKQAGELEKEKEKLQEALRVRENFIEKAKQEQQKTEAELQEAQARLKQLTGDQSRIIAQETATLTGKLNEMKKAGEDLKCRMEDLQDEKKQVEQNLDSRSQDLSKAAQEYRKVVDAYRASQQKLKELTQSQESIIARNTGELKAELKKFQRSEEMLKKKEAELAEKIKNQQVEITKLNTSLKEETNQRYKAEKMLSEMKVSLAASQDNADAQILEQTQELSARIEQARLTEANLTEKLKTAQSAIKERDGTLSQLKEDRATATAQLQELKTRLANLNQEHDAELNKALTEAKKLGTMNDHLVEELNETVQKTLNPVVKAALLVEQADNLSDEQKHQLAGLNYSCRSLIDEINYRAELTQLSSGNDRMEESEFDLHNMMTCIDQQFSHRAETNKLFFAVSFAQYQASNNVPKRVIADEDKIKKTLSILLGYALSKTKKGRLGLHATRESAGDDAMNISFELAYTPVDSKDELISAIFNSEAEAAVDLKHGLTLAKRYITLLGGKAELEFRDAGVTAITINFPFARAGSEVLVDGKKQAGAA